MSIIKYGQGLRIDHRRKGAFDAVAIKDFDPETETFYPVATLEYKSGMSNDWIPGEEIPCRAELCKIIELFDVATRAMKE